MAKDRFPVIFLNPSTKRGQEAYVAIDNETYKWYFNHGQARINFRPRNTFIEALADMLKYADQSKLKPKLSPSDILYWSEVVPKRLPKFKIFDRKKYKLIEDEIIDINYLRHHLIKKYRKQGYVFLRTVKNQTTCRYGLYGIK